MFVCCDYAPTAPSMLLAVNEKACCPTCQRKRAALLRHPARRK